MQKQVLKNATKHILIFLAIAIVTVLLLTYKKEEFQVRGMTLVKYNGTATDVTIPPGIIEIGRLAFQDCDSIVKITIPDGVKYIREGAFANCSNLKTVSIPQSVETIEARAFACDFKLKKVSLPDKLKVLNNEVFYACEALQEIELGPNIEELGNYVFYQCKSLKKIVIPRKVKSMGDSVFSGCENLSLITLPPRDFEMGINVFANCKSLKKITLPQNMKYINTGTFWNCISLESVDIPKHITSIGDRAFYRCSSLRTITFPEEITYIGSEAFYKCENLINITLPRISESKEGSKQGEVIPNCRIGADCFAGCIKLDNVYIPEHVKISSTAFFGCSSLKNVEVAPEHPRYKVIDGVLYSRNTYQLILYPCGLEQKSFIIPDSVRRIKEKAFSGNSHVQFVTAGSKLKAIETGAFLGCERLEDIQLNEKLEDISSEAFEGCSSLRQLFIPEKCNLDISALYDCPSLEEVTVDSDNDSYQSVDGVLFDSAYQTLLLYPASKGGEYYNVPKTVTTISEYAFAGNEQLSELKLPDGVCQIERRAFAKCTNLQKVTMTDSVEIMASEIFYGIEDKVSLTIKAKTEKCIPIIYAENVGVRYKWIK